MPQFPLVVNQLMGYGAQMTETMCQNVQAADLGDLYGESIVQKGKKDTLAIEQVL